MKRTNESIQEELDELRKEYEILKNKHDKSFNSQAELIAYDQANEIEIKRYDTVRSLISELEYELLSETEKIEYDRSIIASIEKHSLE